MSHSPAVCVVGSAVRLSANATYGFPALSSVRSVHVAPWSSDHATHTVLKVFSWVALQPVAALVATLPPSQATYTRPACGPDCTTLMPPGIVSQIDAAWACGSRMTSFGAPNV